MMGVPMWSALIALTVLFQVIRTSDGCQPLPSCPAGTVIDDVLCYCVPCPVGQYNDKPDQYRCKPCATAHMTGSKVCQPWPSECNPLSSRWCALDASCKPVCRRGMYYDSKKKKCSQCPYGTFQPMSRRGCCQVRRCPAGMIPGPSRYNGIFPPLCVKKPETPPPSPARECYSNGTCRRTQVVRVPLTESFGSFDSALVDNEYGKKDYLPCRKVHYELPCREGAVAIVQELQLAAGDLLVIDGVTLRGPTTVDLPQVFFLPPEDMNFTFTSDCHNESSGFRVMYICMAKAGRDYIKKEGLADDCMIRACTKNQTFAEYLLRIGSGQLEPLQDPITCPVSLLLGRYRRPVTDCRGCTPQCLDMGSASVQECPRVYSRFTANSKGIC